MRRRAILRSRVRPGRRARRRVRAGGKLAAGRPSETLAGYRAFRKRVRARAEGKCEVPWCRWRRGRFEMDHVVPRSAGGADADDNCVWLCAHHHRRKHEGRLFIVALGRGRFQFTGGMTGVQATGGASP